MKRDPRQKKPALGGSSSEWLVACTRGPGARNAGTSIPQTWLNQIGIIFLQTVDRDDCTDVSYLNLVELPFPLLGGTHIMYAPRLKVSRLKVQDQAFNQNNTTLQLVSWHFFFFIFLSGIIIISYLPEKEQKLKINIISNIQILILLF